MKRFQIDSRRVPAISRSSREPTRKSARPQRHRLRQRAPFVKGLSGLARAFQYEISQSRIGGSIWETPLRFIENSPLFWLDKVTTPLFVMSNDMDDAVPWYQGIELFVGMRRLGKEGYLINYNNDVHNPAGRANQKDVAMRMQQFFDNKLRGAPAPEWMVKGIPYLAKGRDQLGQPAPATPGGMPPQP